MPEVSPPPLPIIVATHHKAGTVCCLRVFGEICRELGWEFWDMETAHRPEPWHIAFHGKCDPRATAAGASRGLSTFACRPPSQSADRFGGAYHLDAEEAWLDEPRRGFGSRSYRQALAGQGSAAERIRFEMANKSREAIAEMVGLESAEIGSRARPSSWRISAATRRDWSGRFSRSSRASSDYRSYYDDEGFYPGFATSVERAKEARGSAPGCCRQERFAVHVDWLLLTTIDELVANDECWQRVGTVS